MILFSVRPVVTEAGAANNPATQAFASKYLDFPASDWPQLQSIVLLFDIDGTLIDCGGSGGGALLAALQHEFRIADAEMVALHGRTDRGIMTELLTRHEMEPTQANLDRLCGRYYELLPDTLAQRSGRVLPGVLPLLQSLREQETVRLALVTGNMPTSAQMKLEHFRLWDYFESGTFGDTAVERNELSEPSWKMARRLAGADVLANRVVILGDTVGDIELAKTMGVRSLAVCTGGMRRDELSPARPDKIVDDLTQTEEIIHWCLNAEQVSP